MAKAYRCDLCDEFYTGYNLTPQSKRVLNNNLKGYGSLFVKPRRSSLSGILSNVLSDYADEDSSEIDVCKSCLLQLLLDLVSFIDNVVGLK